jgi:hypothetical protein
LWRRALTDGAEQASGAGNVREKERSLAEVANLLQKVRGVVLPIRSRDTR